MIPRPLSIAILACAGLAASSQALALGFGRIPESITFGQALDLTVPLRLDAGESLAPGCVQAEVRIGEQRLPPGALQIVVASSGTGRDAWQLRLRSATVVREPLVAVNLAVGCNGAVTRQFVVFADPASTQAAAPRVARAEGLPAAMAAEAVPRAVRGAGGLLHEAPHAPTHAPARKQAHKQAHESAHEPAHQPAPKAKVDAAQASAQARADTPAVAARSPAAGSTAAQLKPDDSEQRLKAATLAVAAQDAALALAAQTARAAEAAAAEQRLAAMDAQLKLVRDEATAHRSSMELMRQRLAQGDEQGRVQPMLAAAIACLLLLVLWLGWRVRELQRERQAAGGRGAACADEAAARPLGFAGLNEPAAAAAVPAGETDTLPPPAPSAALLPAQAWLEAPLTRPVSVDELIDLEQQAEFFLVLGDEDATVELLMSHLRSSDGTSPLPYLKLLEVYRRRDDRDNHERLCRRFSQRFDAVAPQWDADPEQGRDLQDYPAVLSTLQDAWPRPLDAMEELEKLLLRKRSGELFELPAYRDVLTLYSVARDLHRQQEQPSDDVDVLLPLGGGAAASCSIFDNLDCSVPAPAADDRPTAPVDLDLSEPVPSVRAALR